MIINATPIRPDDPWTTFCGRCGLPLKSAIGAAECAGHTTDVVGMSAAMETFQRTCVAAVPVMQKAVRDMSGGHGDQAAQA